MYFLLLRCSVIAKIVGKNVINSDNFDNSVPMYVYEEMVDGQKLTEIINTKHENVKYLPGFKLPENVVRPLPILLMHLLNQLALSDCCT